MPLVLVSEDTATAVKIFGTKPEPIRKFSGKSGKITVFIDGKVEQHSNKFHIKENLKNHKNCEFCEAGYFRHRCHRRSRGKRRRRKRGNYQRRQSRRSFCYKNRRQRGVDFNHYKGRLIIFFGTENGYKPSTIKQLKKIKGIPVTIPQKHNGTIPLRPKSVYSFNLNIAIAITLATIISPYPRFSSPPLVTVRSFDYGVKFIPRSLGAMMRTWWLLYGIPLYYGPNINKREMKSAFRTAIKTGNCEPESIVLEKKYIKILVVFDPESISSPYSKDVPADDCLFIIDPLSTAEDYDKKIIFKDSNQMMYLFFSIYNS